VKKLKKKTALASKGKKTVAARKPKQSAKSSGKSKVEESVIYHTSGGEMPDPSSSRRTSRKEIIEAFR